MIEWRWRGAGALASCGLASLSTQGVQGAGAGGTHPAMIASRDGTDLAGGEECGGQPFAAIEHGQAAIESLVDLDGHSGIGALSAIGLDLEVMGTDVHGVIVADRTAVFEAADRVQIHVARDRTKRGGAMRRGTREALIVASDVGGQKGVCSSEVGDAREAELTDQPILKGAAEALDAAFRLRRRGGDPLDAEFGQRPADLGGIGPPAQLLLQRQRRLFRSMEDAVVIGVDGDRQAVGGDDLAEEQEVACRILALAEDGTHDGAGGVIDGVEQDEGGAAVLQPWVMTAVHLDEHAGAGHPLTALAVLRRPTAPGAAQAGGAQDSVHGGVGQVEILALGQELGEMPVVDPDVGGAGEADHPLADGGADATGGGAAAIAVHETPDPSSTIGLPKPPKLADREAHERRGLSHHQLAALQGIQDHEPLLRTLRQGDHASPLRTGRGRTFSRKS